MDRRKKVLTLGAIVFLTLAAFANADSLTLTNGKVIEGEIVEETAEAVKINVGDMILTLPRSRVESLHRTAGAEATTSATIDLAPLDDLEANEKWIELYEAAVQLEKQAPKNEAVAKKKELAAARIRETMLNGEKVEELAKRRQWPEAIAALTEALRKSGLPSTPADAVGRRALADLYCRSARSRLYDTLDGHASLVEVRNARSLDPDTPGLDYVEGWAQMKQRNFTEAARMFERGLTKEPQNFGIRYQLMLSYRQTNDWMKIVKAYQADAERADDAAKVWPQVRELLAEAHYRAALDLADKGATATACALYEKHLDLSERTFERMRIAAAFFERMGDPRRAQAAREQRYGYVKEGPETETGPAIKPEWLKQGPRDEGRGPRGE